MNETMKTLIAYVTSHAVRGSCQCGKCIDQPGMPYQPDGHTADMVFFKVANHGGSADELRTLVSEAKKGFYGDVDLFDGLEHNYLELGGWIGDQGYALMLMGLGNVLGLWHLLTPVNMLGLDGEQAMKMAGMGMVAVIDRKIPPRPLK